MSEVDLSNPDFCGHLTKRSQWMKPVFDTVATLAAAAAGSYRTTAQPRGNDQHVAAHSVCFLWGDSDPCAAETRQTYSGACADFETSLYGAPHQNSSPNPRKHRCKTRQIEEQSGAR